MQTASLPPETASPLLTPAGSMGEVATGKSNNPTTRPKARLSVTVDQEMVDEIRRRLPDQTMSSIISDALRESLQHLRHLEAVRIWLDEMEEMDGPVPEDIREETRAFFDSIEW